MGNINEKRRLHAELHAVYGVLRPKLNEPSVDVPQETPPVSPNTPPPVKEPPQHPDPSKVPPSEPQKKPPPISTNGQVTEDASTTFSSLRRTQFF
jgi:hypothetical protein